MTEKPSKEKTIAIQYAELNRLGQNGEYDRALKAANKILGLAPQEFLAFQCKIVCLIQLGKFEEALSLMNKNPEFLQNLIFEKSYCYYRVNKHEEALNTIEKSESPLDLRTNEVKAQIHYRLEHFKEATNIYHEIIKNTDDEYDDERHTNLAAALVYLEQDENNTDEVTESTYELCYNTACKLIASGNYAEAEKKLKICEKLCLESCEDDVPEDDIDVELALIRIQLGYVYQKQARIKEAQQLYLSNLKLKLEDIALMAVASNNLVCINKDQNLFDSKKKMKTALNESLAFKLPSTQRKYIALNNAILSYYLNQSDHCEKICKAIEQKWPDLASSVTLIQALNMFKANKHKETVEYLQKRVSSSENNMYVKLSLAQFLLIMGEKSQACKVLEDLGENSYKPGIVGALTSLYLGMGDEATALKVFEKTVEFYKKNKSDSINLSSLWRQAAEFHIKNGHPQVAANSLEELLVTNKNDQKILAQLILACAQFNKERALKLSQELPSIKNMAKDVDLESLQTVVSTVAFKKSPASKQESLPSTPRSEDNRKKTRKHKKRKGKLPNHCDPNVKPDPERWLPKYERTGYRKKRDRRTKDVIIKGSQGTASGQADQYDFSKYVEEGSTESPASTVEPSPRGKVQPHNQRKGGGQQKRKNKRR